MRSRLDPSSVPPTMHDRSSRSELEQRGPEPASILAAEASEGCAPRHSCRARPETAGASARIE
eukprot:2937020-Alexandrium_andersonii.AAC.1